MIQQKDVTIKGQTYKLTHFNGMVGLKLGKQLVKVLGPSFAAASQGNIVDALETLFENLDDNSEALVIALVSGASKNNMAIDFNSEFAGEYDKLFLLVKEIVEFNYGSVFQMLGSAAQ